MLQLVMTYMMLWVLQTMAIDFRFVTGSAGDHYCRDRYFVTLKPVSSSCLSRGISAIHVECFLPVGFLW